MSGIENGQAVKEGVNTRMSFPKNVRQIGKCNEEPKIYIEDYVVTFLRQLSNLGREDIVIFVGSCGPVEGVEASFISGAICVKCPDVLTKESLSKEIWDEIYGKLQKYFDGCHILGWGCMSQENVSEDNYGFMLNKFANIQRKNFPGNDKVFIHYNLVNDEKTVYVTCNNELRHCQGYYIYYERNDSMQEYMMNENGNVSQEKDYNDEISAKLRKNINDNENIKNGTIVKGKMKIVTSSKVYTLVMAAAVFMLFIAAVRSSGYKKEDVVRAVNDKIGSITSDRNNKDVSDDNYKQNNDNESDSSEQKEIILNESDAGQMEVGEINGIIPEKKVNDDNNTANGNDDKKKKNDNEEKKNDKDNKDNAGEQNTDKNDDNNKKEDDTQNVVKTNADKSSLMKYKVKEGDTLARISIDNYGTMLKVKEICEINNIEDENMIHEGDEIFLPNK